MTGRPLRDLFVGVLDSSTGASQKDVENDLLCKGDSVVSDLDWPFENIAVFSVNSSSRRALEVVAHRVIAWNVCSIGLGNVLLLRRRFRRSLILLFESVELDAEVRLASVGSFCLSPPFPSRLAICMWVILVLA